MSQNPSLLIQVLDGTVGIIPFAVILSWVAPSVEIAVRVLSCKIHAMVIDENYLIGKQLINVPHVSFTTATSLFVIYFCNYLFIYFIAESLIPFIYF